MMSVPVAGAVDDAVGAEQDGLDVGRVRDADRPTMSTSATAAAGVGGHGDAEVGELRRAARRPVPAGDREPGAGQVGGHRRTHRAEAEERDAGGIGQSVTVNGATANEA